jgi:hypothetical protein
MKAILKGVGLAAGLLALAAGSGHSQVVSQTPAPSTTHAATEPGFLAPRTSWGAPDLQGFWSNASLTTMQRPDGVGDLAVSPEEADRIAHRNVYSAAARQEAGASRVDADASRELLADGNASRAYNRFWMDPGQSLALVKGEHRTSWITDPPDGRIPYSEGGIAANTRGTSFDGPEIRPLAERCLMSFTGSYGPVLNNGMYNNTYQIVQSPGAVMILAEMIHDVRVIPIIDRPAAGALSLSDIPRWGGNSAGWYEGEELVVMTVNSHPKQRSFISAQGKVTERFSRWSQGQILYRFEVEDASLYTRAWRGEMSLNASREPLYEYACHEGNYALEGILAGARKLEREGRPHPEVKPIFAGVDVSEGE